ncbi:hypothetical protein CLU79DRAFT_830046 [Phycomyces nitens]|nr:hypothetical protein CLU79DRAFT_830046 [Phycomyces nitens]
MEWSSINFSKLQLQVHLDAGNSSWWVSSKNRMHTDIGPPTNIQHDDPGAYRQHYLDELHQQTGWHPVSLIIFSKNLWRIYPQYFPDIQNIWGPHDVDLFADCLTALLPNGFPLGECNLVPSPSVNGYLSPTSPDRQDHRNHVSSHPTPLAPHEVEVPRVASLKRTLNNPQLSDASRQLFTNSLTESRPTNNSYVRSQCLFIPWVIANEVSLSHLTVKDMINFFTSPDISNYGLNTLQLFRVLLKRAAPPLPMSRPLVDLSPTFTYLSKIASASTAPLLSLSRKTSFLLAMSAFFRPSDIYCIVLSKCSIDGQQLLHLVISAPKETRDSRRIIKSPILHHHLSNNALCPVLAFSTLRDYPATTGRPTESLFVSAKNPSIQVTVATISAQLRTLTQMSTSITPCHSIRSFASDLAIQNGVHLDDIVFMRN